MKLSLNHHWTIRYFQIPWIIIIKLSETTGRHQLPRGNHHPTLSNGPSGSCALLRNQNSPWRWAEIEKMWETYIADIFADYAISKKKIVRTHEKILLVDGEKPPFSPSFLLTPVTSRFPHPRRSFVKKSPAAIPKKFPARVLQLQTLGLQLQLPNPAGRDVFKKSEENHGVTMESMGISVVKSKMGL